MICEIINPSDPYTLRTDDFTVAAVAVAMLGNGQLGLRTLDDTLSTPILFGWDNWFKEQGIDDLSEYVTSNRLRIADVLDTVMIGNVNRRKDVEEMLAMIPEDKRQEWLENRHDRHSSSMNDIGGAARQWAKALREKETAK